MRRLEARAVLELLACDCVVFHHALEVFGIVMLENNNIRAGKTKTRHYAVIAFLIYETDITSLRKRRND